MKKDDFQKNLLRLSLIGLFGLAVISVAGAFLGAERAKRLFNSPVLAAVWIFLLVLLSAGVVCSARVRRRPASLAMHMGCILILGGSLWNSQAGHAMRDALHLSSGPATGFMQLRPGDASDQLRDASLLHTTGKLPFALRLDDFRMEHYPLATEPWSFGVGVMVASPQGMDWRFQPLEWEEGGERPLPQGDVRLRMLKRTSSGPSLAAPRIDVELSLGTNVVRRTLGGNDARPFHHLPLAPLFPEAVFSNRSASLVLMYNQPPVRQYVSAVSVFKDAQTLLQREISVNHPLRYGGYHLYQHSFGQEGTPYTILYAVEEAGLSWVYAGFILLGLGTVAHFWLGGWRRKNGGEA